MNNSETQPKKNQQICLLISGGLDSCVLSHYLLEKQWEVTPIYVQTGLLWESVEIGWVKRFLTHIKSSKLAPLQKISLPVQDIYQSHWSTTGKQTPDAFSNDNEVYLPGRNLVLLVKVALYCAFNNINVINIQGLMAYEAAYFSMSLLPITPSGIGIREGSRIYFFSLIGCNETAVLCASMIMFGLNIILPALIGIASLKYFWIKEEIKS